MHTIILNWCFLVLYACSDILCKTKVALIEFRIKLSTILQSTVCNWLAIANTCIADGRKVYRTFSHEDIYEPLYNMSFPSVYVSGRKIWQKMLLDFFVMCALFVGSVHVISFKINKECKTIMKITDHTYKHIWIIVKITCITLQFKL